jgi:hypothetical protein
VESTVIEFNEETSIAPLVQAESSSITTPVEESSSLVAASDDLETTAAPVDESSSPPDDNPDEPPATEAVDNLGVREFYEDFATQTHFLDDGVSITKRPDAISYDYLTAYTLGPVHLGDFSLGPAERVWRVHGFAGRVQYARQNDARDDFEATTVLFHFSGPAPTELDAAFDQAARILVAMERPTGLNGASEIWIYYFDPFAADYILTNFGPGRTPRALLDDVLDSANADILVFYLRNEIGMCWRQQRERYTVERIVSGTTPGEAAVLTNLQQMNYGPVQFIIMPSGFTSAAARELAGDTSILLTGPGGQPHVEGPVSGYLSGARFRGPGAISTICDVYFDHPIDGFSVELSGQTFPPASWYAFFADGSFITGDFPANTVLLPKTNVAILASGIVRLTLVTADGTSIFSNLLLKLQPASLAVVKSNVPNVGPVKLTNTATLDAAGSGAGGQQILVHAVGGTIGIFDKTVPDEYAGTPFARPNDSTYFHTTLFRSDNSLPTKRPSAIRVRFKLCLLLLLLLLLWMVLR